MDGWAGANPYLDTFNDTLHGDYRRLREEQPVHLAPTGVYRLTRMADVVFLLKKAKCGVRTAEGELPHIDESTMKHESMLEVDEPDHRRLRNLVSKAFTPKKLQALIDEVDRRVDGLLDDMEGRKEVDLVEALAFPLPFTVICGMLGVPDEDREDFIRWSALSTHALLGEQSSRKEEAAVAMNQVLGYIAALIEKRRLDPGEDLFSAMIHAEEEGDRLTHSELIQNAYILLIAGFETTVGLIANGVRKFMLDRDQWDRLQADPGLINTAVEEILRMESPVVAIRRILHEDTEFSGVLIPKGRGVLGVLAAVNRDPEVFPDPDCFDIGRDPNPHLAFGGGAHFCLGAHLARMEGRAALGKLAKRFPNIRLVSTDVVWGESVMRVPASLPIHLE